MEARRLAAAVLFAAVAVAVARPAALELDLGAGAKIDFAPYGVENVTFLATAAPWIGSRDRLQAGLILAASTGATKSDLELAACLRAWPFKAVAVFGGGGFIASTGDGPALVPFTLGGLRLEAGRLGIETCAEIHLKPDDTDSMLWIAALWRLGGPSG